MTEALVKVSARGAACILATHAWDGARIDALVPYARLVGSTVAVAQTLEGNAGGAWIASRTGWAKADSTMVLDPTLGTTPTCSRPLAWVVALVVGTSGCIRAIVIFKAFTRFATASDHRITHLALGTNTRVAPQLVATECGPVAGGVAALIHIHTSTNSICLEAPVAIAHCCMVHRLTPTKATVRRVAWIYTFVALDITKLVAGTVFVGDTFSFYTATRDGIRVAIMARLTLAQRLPVRHFTSGIITTHS